MTCFTLNGKAVISQSSPSTRLSEVLRSEMGLSGTKIGCNAGDCGACSVLLDDEPICSCLTTVAQVGGAKVTSIEGLNAKNIISKSAREFFGPWRCSMRDLYTRHDGCRTCFTSKKPNPKQVRC